MTFDPTTIAGAIVPTPFGYWSAPDVPDVSYPQEGNANCLAVEDASFWFAHRNGMILDAIGALPPPNEIVLDVGGGNGYVAKALQDAGFSAVLLEPNAAGAANAVARGVRTVVRGTLETAKIREGSAGAACLFDVLEHVADDLALLRAIRAALVPRGRLYLTVPAFPALWSADDDMAGHFRRYRLGQLRALFAEAGYRIDYATCFFSLLLLPILLLRVLPSKLGVRDCGGVAQMQSEHAAGWRALRWFLLALLAPERWLVRRRRSLPAGASCLVVATRL